MTVKVAWNLEDDDDKKPANADKKVDGGTQ